MREILGDSVKPAHRLKLGSLLAEIGRKVKLTDEELVLFENMRDKNPARSASLE